jgi:hypothetical protein
MNNYLYRLYPERTAIPAGDSALTLSNPRGAGYYPML